MNKKVGAVLSSLVAVGLVLSGCSSDKNDSFLDGGLDVPPVEKKVPLPELPIPADVKEAANQLDKFGSVQERTWPDGSWIATMRGSVKDGASQCLLWSFTNEPGKPPVLSSFSKEKSVRVIGKKLYCGIPNISGILTPGIIVPDNVWDKMSLSNPRTAAVLAWNAPLLISSEDLRNNLLSITPGRDLKEMIEASFEESSVDVKNTPEGKEVTVRLSRKGIPPVAIEMPGQLPPAITFENANDIDVDNSFDETKRLYPILGFKGKISDSVNRVMLFPVFRDADLG